MDDWKDWRKEVVEIIRAKKTPCGTEATAKTQREWMRDLETAFDNLACRLKHVAIVNHVRSDKGGTMQRLQMDMKRCEGNPTVTLEYTIEVGRSVAGSSDRQREFRFEVGRSFESLGPISIPDAWTVNDVITDMVKCIEGAGGSTGSLLAW